jgi:hypothetical protein
MRSGSEVGAGWPLVKVVIDPALPPFKWTPKGFLQGPVDPNPDIVVDQTGIHELGSVKLGFEETESLLQDLIDLVPQESIEEMGLFITPPLPSVFEAFMTDASLIRYHSTGNVFVMFDYQSRALTKPFTTEAYHGFITTAEVLYLRSAAVTLKLSLGGLRIVVVPQTPVIGVGNDYIQ